MDIQQEVNPERLAECLLSFFKLLEPNKNNRFVLEVAQQTIAKFNGGQNLEITTKEIFLELYPNQSESNASSTLANLWKTLPKLQSKVANRLSEHASNNYGLNVYPWIEKIESGGGAGNLAKYKIIAIPINHSQLVGPNPYRNTIPHDIEYIAVKDFQPSWLARHFFDPSNAIVGGKKWVMIFFPIIKMLFYISMVAVFFWVIQKQTIANVSIYYLGCMIAAVLFFFNEKNRFERFSDDRIIIASEYFTPWSESFLLQELVTVKDEKDNYLFKKVQLTKYVAVCPICKAQVVLAKGEPDFHRRIIGRCNESPREHVYSFDRITKLGVLLHQNAIRPLVNKSK